MSLRSSYLAYKRDTSRLVFLLVTASNAVLSVKKLKAKLNTSRKLDSLGFISSAELISKHMKSIPCEIPRLLKSVIELRTSHYAEFQRRVAANPNFEMEESNKSHKHFIDVLTQTLDILGGEGVLGREKAQTLDANKGEISNEDFLTNYSNIFAHLDIQDVDSSDGDDDGSSICDAGQTTSQIDPARRARPKPTKGKKGKSSRAKQSSNTNRKHQKRLGKLSIEQYGISDDHHYVAAEYFLAASALLEQSIDLRYQCQQAWHDVAYDGYNPLMAVATCGQSLALVQRSHTSISGDFAGSHSYMNLINAYTRGGIKNLQPRTTIRVCRKGHGEDCCVSMQEMVVSREPMRELLMEHAYNDLVEFLQDFGKTSSGAPSKSMQAEISQWNPMYDLEAATDEERLGWRRVYTINWLYGLVGYYWRTKKQIDDQGTRTKPGYRSCRRAATPWAEEYSFFGLGPFARSIISLARTSTEAAMENGITPQLVFQVQCIVDSFTAFRGWTIDDNGHILRAPPLVEGLPQKSGIVGWFESITCGNQCQHHQGLTRSVEWLADLHATSQTRHGAFGNDTLSLVWNSWWNHHQVMVKLRNDAAPCPRANGAHGHMDEFGLFYWSPFLCGSTMLQTIELFYRYAMVVWDTTPEIIVFFHLHNMLMQTGVLKEPVELFRRLTVSFLRDLFGETLPDSDFYQAFMDRQGASRFAVPSLIQPLLMDRPLFRQFHMSDRFFKTRSSFLVFHEAGWEAAAVSPLRTSSLHKHAYLRNAIENFRDRSSFDCRKRFTKIPKNGHDIDLPHFDPNSDHVHETTLMTFGNYALERDLCMCCPAPLSMINFVAVTAQLLSMWIAFEEKLMLSGHVPSDREYTATSSLGRDAVEVVLTNALRGDDDGLIRLLAEVFEENRGAEMESFSYFSKETRE